MRARTLLAGVAAALLIPIGPAAAQEVLDAGEIDATAHPTVEVVVSTPGGAGDPSEFTIIEGDTVITPTVEALSAGQLEVVLAIDTSGSMNGAPLASARDAARGFIQSLPVEARVAVIGFGATPVAATQLTRDRTAIDAAIQSLTAGGETALYDAVIISTIALENSDPGARRALVVLSDGGDTVSGYTLDEAADFAAAGFDVVHAIGLQTSEQDTASLDRIVSGGGSVAKAEDPVALSAVYADVANRIVNQYSLTWETTVAADTDVVIGFTRGSTTYEATRTLDVDESLVAPPADLTPTTEPDPTPTTPPRATTDPADSTPLPVENSGTLPGIVLLIGLVTMFGALFLAGLNVFGPRERKRNLAAEFRQRVPRGRQLTGAGKRLVETVESFLRKDPERHSGLALRLDRAGLDWTPAEFGAVLVAGAAVLAVLGFGIFGFFGLLLLPLAGVVAGLAALDHRGSKRSRLFTAQLDSTLQLIAGSLRSGFGIMQALGTVAEETEWPTSEEFTRILGEVRLGRDLGDALESSARRVDSEDYGWVVQAIEISREVGGNLAEVLDNVSRTIRQRNTLRRQVRALSAEGRMSALILFLLPFVMFIWMRISNGEYIDLLFTRTGGQIAVVIALGLMTVGALWMRKIVQVKF